jgi:hypothetical protein
VLAALALIIRLLKHGGPTRIIDGVTSVTSAGTARPDDYGLLRPVSLIGDLAFARDMRDRLRSNGVRATVATGQDGMVHVLVFADEYDRARRLIRF